MYIWYLNLVFLIKFKNLKKTIYTIREKEKFRKTYPLIKIFFVGLPLLFARSPQFPETHLFPINPTQSYSRLASLILKFYYYSFL